MCTASLDRLRRESHWRLASDVPNRRPAQSLLVGSENTRARVADLGDPFSEWRSPVAQGHRATRGTPRRTCTPLWAGLGRVDGVSVVNQAWEVRSPHLSNRPLRRALGRARDRDAHRPTPVSRRERHPAEAPNRRARRRHERSAPHSSSGITRSPPGRSSTWSCRSRGYPRAPSSHSQ